MFDRSRYFKKKSDPVWSEHLNSNSLKIELFLHYLQKDSDFTIISYFIFINNIKKKVLLGRIRIRFSIGLVPDVDHLNPDPQP